ncbi:MAG: MBL fold metallo-hydrolase [Chloroflexia bacterium]|nr:MBL fold metallo-hydrolase [Chloroflexia bacterium]
MKLTVLGGSAASPNAGMGCSGYLVEAGSTCLVLDLGPGTLPELRRHADFRTLDAIVISHMHVDHVLDLLALRHALAYNPVPSPRPTPVWLPPGGADVLAHATAPFDACDEPGTFAGTVDIREYDPTQPLAIGDAVVTFAPTVHYVPAWAIRVDTQGRALGYTGDTGPTADLAPFFRGVQVLVAEATLLDAGDRHDVDRGSLTAAEAGALADAAAAEILVLSHLWQERGFEASRVQAAAAFGRQLELARPGSTVEW